MSAPTLKRSDTGYWFVHWSDGGRSKRVSTRTKDLVAAKAFLSQWLMLETSEPKSVGKTYTIRELWSLYEKNGVRSSLTHKSVMTSWKQLERHFGDLTLAQVNEARVNAYVTARMMGKNCAPAKTGTIRKELVYLRAALNWCADRKRKIISTDDLPAFDLPDASPPRERWLTHAEVQKLLNAAAGMRIGPRLSRLERFLWLALETGGRLQALKDLTWDRVDFETGVIDLDVPGRKKTSKGRAAVPMSKALRPIMERAFAERTGERVLDSTTNLWAPVQLAAVRAGLAPAAYRFDDARRPTATGISPHTLRHTAATHMARRGVPLWLIAKVLGNSLLVVEKVYAKHAPDDLRVAVDAISGGHLTAAE